MAQFRGILNGARGIASRLGNKNSGLTVEAQSWQGKVVVDLSHDSKTGKDFARVSLAQHHSHGMWPPKILYYGPVSGEEVTA